MTKVLIRQHGCTSRSTPLLLACNKIRFSAYKAKIILASTSGFGTYHIDEQLKLRPASIVFLEPSHYCRFRNFLENFIFMNSIKRHISDVKNLRLRQDIPISINNRVIVPFREGFTFMKLCICEVSRK